MRRRCGYSLWTHSTRARFRCRCCWSAKDGCRVRIDLDSVARLENQPLPGPTPDAERFALGESFQIEGQDGVYRIERLSGEAGALVINRVS